MHRSNLDFHGTAQLLRLGIAATVAGADYNPVAAPSEHLAIEPQTDNTRTSRHTYRLTSST